MAPSKEGRPSANKFDPSDQYRTEIVERTENGESCEKIASSLRARGVNITNKTISRRRVEWGLRQRPPHKYAGMKHPKPRPKRGNAAYRMQNERKAEIEARTKRGESAEQIAEALISQGAKLNRGASSILRLQTYWGFIPPDKARARGRDAAKKKEKREAEKTSKREREKEANLAQQRGNMHYPSDCSFGPKKRANGLVNGGNGGEGGDVDLNVDPELLGNEDLQNLAQVNGAASSHDGVSIAAEIMSVDFLVDLANSTLGTAHNLKEMLLAYQSGVPVQNSASRSPPTLEDLSSARKKVREAAAVMHDLAVEPGSGGGLG